VGGSAVVRLFVFSSQRCQFEAIMVKQHQTCRYWLSCVVMMGRSLAVIIFGLSLPAGITGLV